MVNLALTETVGTTVLVNRLTEAGALQMSATANELKKQKKHRAHWRARLKRY
jgi:hypothetical protein